MILTGACVVEEVGRGRITIDPFDPKLVNPNSYNYRLGPILKRYDEETRQFEEVQVGSDGYVLQPNRMYLGHTFEVIGSSDYAMSLVGRSSTGRLGLFVQLSANLGHTTSCHRWTLEIVAARPLRLHSGMVLGQVSFWRNTGVLCPTSALYAAFDEPRESARGGHEP